MPEFSEIFSEVGLDRVAGPLSSLAQESIRLTAIEYDEAPASRLGGRPNLPPDLEWPIWEETPLAFIAQIDLPALPEVAGLDLPRSGALYFFWRVGENAYHTKDRGLFRVLYSDQPLAPLPLREFPEHLAGEFRYQGVRLTVERREVTFPLHVDPALDHLNLSHDEQQRYAKFKAQLEESRPEPRQILQGYPAFYAGSEAYRAAWDNARQVGVHRIGGYPDFIQHDPKLQAHLIALDLYLGIQVRDGDALHNFRESNRRSEEVRKRVGAGAQDWQLLLLVDSEQSADILWGDVGQIYFVIRKDDLRRRAFENVWMLYDCY